jgi:hypothetical protein
MILQPLPSPDAGPVPEDSTFVNSRWLDLEWHHPFLDKKPAEVHEFHEPTARAVAFAVALIMESRKQRPDPETVEYLAQQLEYFLGIAGPIVNDRWTELDQVRRDNRLDPFVEFMGSHPNAHAAALAYPKQVVRLLAEARLAEYAHVEAARKRGNTRGWFSWVRVALQVRAGSAGTGDPAPLMMLATQEALGWHLSATGKTPSPAPLPPARHSIDFRSVHWFGADYCFTPGQAAIVKQLWAAWENGTPDVGQETLTGNSSLESNRIVDVFKDRDGPKGLHPALGRMIVGGGTKGAFRLQAPPG